MTTVDVSRSLAPRRAPFFGVCLALELVAFAMLPLSPHLPTGVMPYLQACLSASLLAGALASRRLEAARPYSDVLYALFVGSAAVPLGVLLGGRTLDALSLVTVSPAWIALSRLSEVAWRTLGIVLLMAAGGASLQSIYVTRGRVRFGLGVGLAGLTACAVPTFAPMLANPGSRNTLLALMPWVATFALANGFGEELLFRGLLLGRLEPLLGKAWSNMLTAVAYTVLRAPAPDASHAAAFVAALFALALACGWLMQKTGSVWGSALLHAGADCLLILRIDGRL